MFLPAAGFRYGADVSDVGGYGYYWSSSPYAGYADLAWRISFYSGYLFPVDLDDRRYGQSVRLVRPL